VAEGWKPTSREILSRVPTLHLYQVVAAAVVLRRLSSHVIDYVAVFEVFSFGMLIPQASCNLPSD
jgi:hypothetical protein